MGQPNHGSGHPYFGKLDPERRWLYRVEFTVPGLNTEVLAINASSVSLPTYQIEATTINFLNQDVKVAGRPSLGEMTVTFYSGYAVNLDAISILEEWSRKIFTPSSEEIGFANEYKAEGTLVVMTPRAGTFKTYEFQGAWPTNIGEKSYEWAASDNVTRSVTFSVDKVIDPNDGIAGPQHTTGIGGGGA